ncbi:type IV secretory system conjugative DNA transfer family protein [Levilactobacillus brevis]|uniref:Type IV secretory system conjugative DNA transfer family protein n=1 Tax=Levilactobacillus brevis TaxID=1580 RepID=A0AA41ES20_LEVBR|nr:type IV secretory system conjugative DNA transfer family protein [Levilactobacillus brevis]MBS0948607.1 type IV secretory system conjugative DNA transfer family protein [Levilactobacillus brevis]MBS1011820.1 type IV secretory system conjugative DNA transfer family protein [Levilactobacillus brevis]
MVKNTVGSGRNARTMKRAPWWVSGHGSVVLICFLIVVVAKIIANVFTWGLTKVIGLSYGWFQELTQHKALRNVSHFNEWQQQSFSLHDVLRLSLPMGGLVAWLSLLVCLATAGLVIWRYLSVYRSYNYAEHGAESFASAHEIKKSYHLVPDRIDTFSGVGGIPISHFNGRLGRRLQFLAAHQNWPRNKEKLKRLSTTSVSSFWSSTGKYAIDTDTNNTLAIGITRSGKGETFVLPTIDLLTRAEEKTSIVVNDPKGELSRLSQSMLTARGYRVLVLDLQNMANSMGYNPLSIIVNYAKRGNWAKVQMETNRLSTAIYAKDKSSGNSQFWDNSSINLLNALILAQIDLAQRHQSWEKVSLHNVYEMMTELGGQSVTDENGKESSYLTLYFQGLRELNQQKDNDDSAELRRLALDAFSQSKFAGDETAGSIYASMMEGIKIYQQRDLAQLTAENSFDIRESGFPRWLTVQFAKSLSNQPVNVSMLACEENGSRKLIEKRRQQLDEVGWLDYPIKHKLTGDFVFRLDLPTDLGLDETTVEIDGQVKVGLGQKRRAVVSKFTGPALKTNIHYSEQPVALFLRTPPDNPSYNQIVSFLVDQSFNQLFGMATASGGKTFTRVHYLLDEFGNLPPIAHMDTKVSIGLGANILFSLVVQNLSQLRINYSDEQAQTIESNCANTVYILTKELKTAETISKSLGQTTITSYSHQSRDSFGATQQDFGNSSDTGVDLLSATELMHLNMGESLVLRTKRNSLTGADVRNNPIFNRNTTKMPQRWQFLGQTFYEDSGSLQALSTSPALIDLQALGYQYDEELILIGDPLGNGDTEESVEDVQGQLLNLTFAQWSDLDDQAILNYAKQLMQALAKATNPKQVNLLNDLKTVSVNDPIQVKPLILNHWADFKAAEQTQR